MANALKLSLVMALTLSMSGCAALNVLKAPINLISNLVPSGGGKTEAKTEEEEPSTPKKVVGTVRFSYENFVLIYSPTNAAIPPGTMLTTIAKDGTPQTVELKMSAERKGSFLVADVVKGNPKSGHVVVTSPSTAPPSQSDYQVLQ